MSNPYLAEIRIMPTNFAPNGWAFCDGQILPISQNTALFSLLGTNYGGDGKSNFALPNLQGCAPMFYGQGPGLSQRYLGETGGESSVTLLMIELPMHTHGIKAVASGGTQASASGAAFAEDGATRGAKLYDNAQNTTMGGFGLSGGTLPHNNMPPYLTLNFVIALQGVYPSRP